ncbi:hypothetical protein [Actinophytocola xanthii]|uniref:Integral membrane regulator n=1 Tax=Actinophytocola xanthii TaxID=1912961 RepID=A0A1Q8CZ10_9PSEU|nr:hypothetical protein BU204_01400 [Actinophytocola xanthii]
MDGVPVAVASRLVVAVCAFVGLGFAVATLNDPWPALSQQASLFAGVVYLALALAGARAARVSGWLRGATTVLLLLVCLTYLTVIEGDLYSVSSLFEHLLTPLAALADWVLVGRAAVVVRWWYPLSWVLPPLLYLIYFLVADVGLYRGFLDPQSPDFATTVALFLVAVVAAGYLLYGIVRPVRTRAVAEAG